MNDLDTPIREVDFSALGWVDRRMVTRMQNALMRAGIMTLGDLLQQTRNDLGRIEPFGPISIAVIVMTLQKLGLELKADE